MNILYLLSACVYVEPSTTWFWSGNIYLRDTEGLANTEEIEASVTYPTGALLQNAKTPSGKNSPYRRFEFNEEQYGIPVNIRVNGLNGYSTLWASQTPSHINPTGGENDIWLNGALYIQGQAFQQSFLNSIGFNNIPFLIDPETNEAQDFTHLWGQPSDPTKWGGAYIEVLVIEADLSDVSSDTGAFENSDIVNPEELDWSSASSYDVDVIEITEEGLILPLENPVPADKEPSLFFAFSLPPGHTRLRVTTGEGEVIITDYASLSGEVLSAMYFSF